MSSGNIKINKQIIKKKTLKILKKGNFILSIFNNVNMFTNNNIDVILEKTINI